jgi:hypothetical protein
MLLGSSLSFVSCNSDSKQPQVNTRNSDDRVLIRNPKSFGTVGDETRIALVIGNSNYQKVGELKNPVNDASDMKTALEKVGFTVFYLKNGTKREMITKIRDFQKSWISKKNVVALFYYAGHGLEADGTNYLVPIDADIETRDEIDYSTVSFNFILKKFENSKNRMNIAILDSCRNNPFRNIRDLEGGLGSAQAKGTFIAFATALNSVAEDNQEERNGLFTKHILKNIHKSDLKLEDMFKEVAKGVAIESNQKQIPWRNSSIFNGDFYFAMNETEQVKTPVQPQPEPKPEPTTPPVDEVVYEDGTIGSTNTDQGKSTVDVTEVHEHFKLKIIVNPYDAKVEFLNKNINFINDGLYKKGVYKLRVSKDNFYSEEFEINLNNHTSRTVNLRQSKFKLNLNLEPSDAKVKFTNRYLTFQNGIYLKPKKYNLEIKKSGFVTQKVIINLKSDTNLDISLKKIAKPINYNNYSGNEKTFKDTSTNLMWQIPNFTKQDKKAYHGSFESENIKTWNNAVQHCKNLNFAGYSDWRLPEKDELKTLLTENKNDWLYIKKPFVESTQILKGGKYNSFTAWTNTTYKRYSSESWVVGFNDGGDDRWDNHYGDGFVVCVRDL